MFQPVLAFAAMLAGSPQVDAVAVVDGGRRLEPVEAGGDVGGLVGEVGLDRVGFGELGAEVIGERVVRAGPDLEDRTSLLNVLDALITKNRVRAVINSDAR